MGNDVIGAIKQMAKYEFKMKVYSCFSLNNRGMLASCIS